MAKPALPRIAVLGAGPVGLEAALYGVSAGLPVTVYEAGQPGEYLSRWGFVRLFTPFGLNSTPLGRRAIERERLPAPLPTDTAFQTGREFRDGYLVPLATSAALKDHVRTQTSVLGVGRVGPRGGSSAAPFRLLLRGPNGVESFAHADAVLDCTGTYARPNWIGDGGLPAAGELAARQFLPYWLEDVRGAKKASYAGRSVIVVGGGLSAAAVACDLAEAAAENPATWVTWLARDPRTQPLPRVANDPLRERDRLAARANALATRGDGNVEFFPGVRIDEVRCDGPDKGVRVVGRVGGEVRTWEAERLIAHVGYKPDVALTAELKPGDPAPDGRTAEPNYFALGAKSRGRDSRFLLRDGHEQVRAAYAAILGQGRLNLYAA